MGEAIPAYEIVLQEPEGKYYSEKLYIDGRMYK
jgi:hypothetical protein